MPRLRGQGAPRGEKTCPVSLPFGEVAGSVVLVTVLFFLTFVSRFIFSPLMPAIGRDIAVTAGQAGSVFFLGSIGGLAGSLAAGFLSQRIDHRGTLLTATLGAAVVLVAAAWSGSVWSLRGVMFLLGVFAGINQPSVVATITAMVRRQDWGKALSVQQAAPPMALVAGPLLAVGLLSLFSWRWSLVCLGVAAAAVAVVFVRLGPVGDFPGEPPRLGLVGPILRGRSFWLMVLLFALGMGAQVGVYTMLPLYLTGERAMSVDRANTLLGVANLSPLAMVFVSGWVTDRIGELRAMFVFLLLTGMATVLVGALHGAGLVAALFLLPAFAVCFFPPAFSALARIVQPNLRSVAAALAPPVAFILGGGLLPTGLGYMGQRASFALGIEITGAVIVVAAAGALFVRVVRDEDMEEGC